MFRNSFNQTWNFHYANTRFLSHLIDIVRYKNWLKGIVNDDFQGFPFYSHIKCIKQKDSTHIKLRHSMYGNTQYRDMCSCMWRLLCMFSAISTLHITNERPQIFDSYCNLLLIYVFFRALNWPLIQFLSHLQSILDNYCSCSNKTICSYEEKINTSRCARHRFMTDEVEIRWSFESDYTMCVGQQSILQRKYNQ